MDDFVSRDEKPKVRQIFMKSLRTNATGRRHRASGFSLMEVIVVLAISIVVSVISVISLVPMIAQYRIANAYNITLASMRQARDNAVSQRTSYQVTFTQTVTPPVTTTITVSPTLAGFAGDQNTVTYQLPNDVFYLVPPTGTTGPDGYGTGLNAIDFGYTAHASGGSQTVYFCPDGSAQDDSTGNCLGNVDGGIVYIARAGDLLSSRAVTLWGATGRIRGWRLYPNGSGGYQWVRGQ